MKKKMIDVGKKPESMEVSPVKKSEKYYPSIHLTDKALPCLQGCKVGEKLSLLMDCEITGTTKRNDDPAEFTLEVHKIGEEKHMKMSKAMEEAAEDETKKEE